MPDGSMFTGTMQTKNKAGKDILINYKNGLITNSFIDGKIFKTYNTPTGKVGREKGVLIRQYNKDERLIKTQCDIFHTNGKISKTISNKEGALSNDVLEFSPNGKKIAEYKTHGAVNNLHVGEGKIFNEDGTVKIEFNGDYNFNESKQLPNNSTMNKYYTRYKLDRIDEQLATKKMGDCVRLEVSNGDINESIEMLQSSHNLIISHGDDTAKKSIGINNNYTNPSGEKSTQISIGNKKYSDYICTEDEHYHLNINPKNGSVTSDAEIPKAEVEEVIAMIENGSKRAMDEGMYKISGKGQKSEKEIASIFERVIQSLKDYASTL